MLHEIVLELCDGTSRDADTLNGIKAMESSTVGAGGSTNDDVDVDDFLDVENFFLDQKLLENCCPQLDEAVSNVNT